MADSDRDWVFAAPLSEVPRGRGLEVVVSGRIVGLFRSGDEVLAIDGVCPHQGGPLAQGTIEQGCAVCPWHGWCFDLRTGRHHVHPNLFQEVFPVRVDAGDVYVAIEKNDVGEG